MEKALEKKLRKKFYHIKERCTCKTNKRRNQYWGRWIKCERESIEDFIRDMWPSFEEHVNKYWINETTIDRINTDWNYCKENCRWATWHEQAKNRRECRAFDYDWKHFETLRDLANYVWLPEDTIRYRLKYWWDLNNAVTKKIRNNKLKIEYKWITYESLSDLCKKLWKSRKIVYSRLQSWWALDDAIEIPKKYLNNYKQSKCIHSTT